jgi:hypothetical protein
MTRHVVVPAIVVYMVFPLKEAAIHEYTHTRLSQPMRSTATHQKTLFCPFNLSLLHFTHGIKVKINPLCAKVYKYNRVLKVGHGTERFNCFHYHRHTALKEEKSCFNLYVLLHLLINLFGLD